MKKICKLWLVLSLFVPFISFAQDYSLLDADHYKNVLKSSRKKASTLLVLLDKFREEEFNAQVAHITELLVDLPYIYTGAMGEGDWQVDALEYQSGASHIQQNPVYQFDAFDCQTFVQAGMGLLYARDLKQFDETILKIAYGAAGNPNNEIVRYYNRNNFIDGDFNPINQRQGYLVDMTATGELAPYGKIAKATLTRQKWFLRQQKEFQQTVSVLNAKNGQAMVERFNTLYANLPFPNFKREEINIAYLPKDSLVLETKPGHYVANETLLNKIPTPAILEVVRDVKKWNINGKNIKDLIGSELTISHFGFLYRDYFNRGELIYRQITCTATHPRYKTCQVTPVYCNKKRCDELMFAHATDAYPYQYYWYQQSDGNFACTITPPQVNPPKLTTCNRIERVPLISYLTSFQNGKYVFMRDNAILGVHIEQLIKK